MSTGASGEVLTLSLVNPGSAVLPCEGCAGRSSCPFSVLPQAELEDFLCPQRLRFYPRGAKLFEQGEPAHSVFLSRSAILKLFHLHESGKCTAMSFVRPGGAVGLIEAVLGGCYQRTAKVVVEGELHCILRTDLVRFVLTRPAVAFRMLIAVSEYAKDLLQDLIEVGCVPPEERLLRMLLKLSGDGTAAQGKEISFDLPVAMQDLADSIGCSRQWTSTILGETAKNGLIRRHGRSIVLSRRALDLLARDDPYHRAELRPVSGS